MKSQHTGDKVTGTAKATKVCCRHSQLEEMLIFSWFGAKLHGVLNVWTRNKQKKTKEIIHFTLHVLPAPPPCLVFPLFLASKYFLVPCIPAYVWPRWDTKNKGLEESWRKDIYVSCLSSKEKKGPGRADWEYLSSMPRDRTGEKAWGVLQICDREEIEAWVGGMSWVMSLVTLKTHNNMRKHP